LSLPGIVVRCTAVPSHPIPLTYEISYVLNFIHSQEILILLEALPLMV